MNFLYLQLFHNAAYKSFSTVKFLYVFHVLYFVCLRIIPHHIVNFANFWICVCVCVCVCVITACNIIKWCYMNLQ
jgi:hypothetical protein